MGNLHLREVLVSVHGIGISLRQLKRILRRLRCTRLRRRSNLNEVVEAVEEELRGSGSLLGCRAMHQRLINQRGLVTTREVVRHVLRVFDPEGVDCRSQHRLRRRMYRCTGPNYLWHIDCRLSLIANSSGDGKALSFLLVLSLDVFSKNPDILCLDLPSSTKQTIRNSVLSIVKNWFQ